jgi:hypothetical protein
VSEPHRKSTLTPLDNLKKSQPQILSSNSKASNSNFSELTSVLSMNQLKNFIKQQSRAEQSRAEQSTKLRRAEQSRAPS